MQGFTKWFAVAVFALFPVLIAAWTPAFEFVVYPVIPESETVFFNELGQWQKDQGKNAGAESAALFASRGPAFGYAVVGKGGANYLVFPAWQAGLSGTIDVESQALPGKKERVAVLSVDYESGLALAAWPSAFSPLKKGAAFAEIRITAPQALQSGGIRAVPVKTVQEFVERTAVAVPGPNRDSLQQAAIALCRDAAARKKPHFPLSERISDSYALKYGVSMLKEALPFIDDDVKTDIFAGLENVFPLRGVKRAIAALIVLNYFKEPGDVLAFREIPETADMTSLPVTVFFRAKTEAVPATFTLDRGIWKLEKIPLRHLLPSEPVVTPAEVITDVDFSPPYQSAYLGFASMGTDPLAPVVLGGMLELPTAGNLMMRISGGGGFYKTQNPSAEEFMLLGGYQIDYRLTLSWGSFSFIPYATVGGTASLSPASGNLVPLTKYGAGMRFKFGDDPRIVFGGEACYANLVVTQGTPPAMWVFSVYGGLAEY